MENNNFGQIQTSNQNAGILDCEYADGCDLFCPEDYNVCQSIDNYCIISGGYDGEHEQPVLGKRDRRPSVTETDSEFEFESNSGKLPHVSLRERSPSVTETESEFEFESNSGKLPHVSLREPSEISSGGALHSPQSDTLQDIIAIVDGASYRSHPTQEFYIPMSSSDLTPREQLSDHSNRSFADPDWPVYMGENLEPVIDLWPWTLEGLIMPTAAAPCLGFEACCGREGFYKAEWQTEYTGDIHQAVYDADVSEELLGCMSNDLEGEPNRALLTLIKYISGVQKTRFKVQNTATSHEIDVVASLLQRQRNFAGPKAVLRLVNIQTALFKKTLVDQLAEIRPEIGQSETVFIPCYDVKHWSLLVLFTDKSGTHRVLFIDSMRAPCVSDTAKAAAYLASKAMWQVGVLPEIVRAPARQTNRYDCGYFVIENIIRAWIDLDGFVDCLDRGKAPFMQADVTASMTAIKRVFDTIRQRGAGLQGSVNIFRNHLSAHYKIK